FFDTRPGVAGLTPLHDRIRFISSGGRASLRQAQLELTPFDQERLRGVALRLRDLYPARDKSRLEAEVSVDFVERLVQSVTAGFKGDVGIVPRQFLREFVTQMDLVDENEDYSLVAGYDFTPRDLRAEEQTALGGRESRKESADEDLVPMEDAW
ncbi:MAG: BREX system ATP-binding domain-containing protein, partial [Planctomyces sp.]